jgi:tetratricopeptide (TPR) repeat protein
LFDDASDLTAVGPRRRAAERAVALAPDLSEAHSAMGAVLFGEWDWAGTKREYERAIELNPDSAEACGCYPAYMLAWGDFEKATAMIEHAVKVNPLSGDVHAIHALVAYVTRRHEVAVREAARARELEPRHGFATMVGVQALLALGQPHQALTQLKAEGLGESHAAGVIYARLGDRARAQRIANALLTGERSLLGAATVWVALGDHDRAIAAITRAFDRRESGVRWMNVNPMFDDLRADPRLQALIARLKLPA